MGVWIEKYPINNKENLEDCLFMGGDFNKWIGEREAKNLRKGKRDGKKSRDKVKIAAGTRLMESI